MLLHTDTHRHTASKDQACCDAHLLMYAVMVCEGRQRARDRRATDTMHAHTHEYAPAIVHVSVWPGA